MRNFNFNHSSGRLLTALVLLFSLGIGNAWAGSDYFATLEANVANSSGIGKVYAGTSENSSKAGMYSSYSGSSTNEDGKTTIKAWIYAESGYAFYKWEYISAVRYTKTKNTNHTPGDIAEVQTANPLSITMCTPKDSKDNADLASFLIVRAIFWRPGGANITQLKFRTTENGKYSVKSVAKEGVTQTEYEYRDIRGTEKEVSNVVAGMPIDCKAVADDGYIFYSYYTMDAYGNKAYVGDLLEPNQVILIDDDVVELGAEFTDNAFRIGDTFVKTLSDALQVVNTSVNKTIQVVRSHEVEPGYYTIPVGVTLLVPKNVRQQEGASTIERLEGTAGNTPSMYRCLTLGAGVKLDVFGTIEVSGTQASGAQGATGAGMPRNPYGQIIMKEGSQMILEDGASLRAWGFITGYQYKNEANKDTVTYGEIDARRGSVVYEQFQMYDWKGGTHTSSHMGNHKVFPVTQYYIQNVEVPTTYRPGSALWALTSVYVSSSIKPGQVQLVGLSGDDALFLMEDKEDSEDTWVRKTYDANKDVQLYEINSAAQLSAVYLNVSGYSFNSKSYILPITNNFKIKVLYGNLDITQDVNMLPGSEIEINKEAKATILPNMSLYLYDADEWGKYVFSGAYGSQVAYTPTYGGKPEKRTFSSKTSQPDVAINVHGVMDVQGYLYTTMGGANIYSNNSDAGTILFNKKASTDTINVYQWMDDDKIGYNSPAKCTAAKLKNDDGSYATTAGTDSLKSFCFLNGKWTKFSVDSDSVCFVYDNYGVYYAKPAGYVAINAQKDPSTKMIYGNNDHTYSDADGNGKLYILVEDCQWWEVENKDNLYHCTHPQNDTYYYWKELELVKPDPVDETTWYTIPAHWEEKKFAISWKDYDGTAILDANAKPIVYHLPYGAIPQYLSTNPTRPADPDTTYNFKGWSPAIDTVKGDQIYTAVYDKIPVKYEIVFKYEEGIKSGSVIKRQFLVRDAIPEPPTLYPIEGYSSYEWTPAIGAVTGNQVYEAKWLENVPETYAITFKNFDGITLKKSDGITDAVYEVTSGERPEYDGAEPTKDMTAEYAYSFAGWKALDGTVYPNDNLPLATVKTSYVAQFNSAERKFDIRFFDENGIQLGATQSLRLGADPVVPEYSKDNTEEYTYTLQWKIKDTETIVGVSVPSVSSAADYQADFISTKNRYTITANSENENGESIAGCTFIGAGTYDYGTEITLTAVLNTGYEFGEWKDNHSKVKTRTFSVTKDTTYTAIVKPAALVIADEETKVVTRSTKVSSLVVKATPTTSSNLVGAQNVSLTSSSAPVYFDLTRGAGKVFKHHTWYAFSVPFEVDPATILFDGATMQYNQVSKKDDYEIRYYDGSERALNGKTANCWVLAETAGEHLYPGKFYMIANTRRDVTTIRFPKVAGATLLTTSVNVATYSSGNAADANWNGIANPALYHANMDAIGTAEHAAYVFNPDFEDPTNAYQKIFLNSQNMKLGTPFFVQAPTAKPVVVEPLPTGPASAPRRAKANADEAAIRYQVVIAREGGNATDDVIIRMDEEKEEDAYVLGRDLVRMGMSSINPQIWVARYDEKLCVNVQAPLNNVADYPLGIFAPANSTYEVSIANQPNDETTLYLTIDGEAVWNLSEGAYSLYLDGGTTNHYGLRIVSKKAPEVATGMDEAVVDAHGATQKVLINNQVYIIRGNKVYTVDGQLVK